MLSYVRSGSVFSFMSTTVSEDLLHFLRALLHLSSVIKEILHFCEQRWSQAAPLPCLLALGRMISQIFSVSDRKKQTTRL